MIDADELERLWKTQLTVDGFVRVRIPDAHAVIAELRALRAAKAPHGPTCSECKGKGWLNTTDQDQIATSDNERVALLEVAAAAQAVVDAPLREHLCIQFEELSNARRALEKALAAIQEPKR